MGNHEMRQAQLLFGGPRKKRKPKWQTLLEQNSFASLFVFHWLMNHWFFACKKDMTLIILLLFFFSYIFLIVFQQLHYCGMMLWPCAFLVKGEINGIFFWKNMRNLFSKLWNPSNKCVVCCLMFNAFNDMHFYVINTMVVK